MAARRTGAPRLIDWTGERCVPWAPNVQVVYEHYHRYLWAQALVAGARVLDLGSGEGFGAAMLADTAPRGGRHRHRRADGRAQPAQLRRRRTSSSAWLGDRPGGLSDDSFDVVVAFEVIEHVASKRRCSPRSRACSRPTAC